MNAKRFLPVSRRALLRRFPLRLAAVVAFARWPVARARIPAAIGESGPHLHRAVFDDGLFVVTGAGGLVATSSDGEHWTVRDAGTVRDLRGVARTAEEWVVVGDGGVILTSPDAVAWVRQASPIDATLHDVAFGRCRLVAVGASGTVITSFDGRRWRTVNSGVSSELRCVVHAETEFLAGGANHVLLRSKEGARWLPHRPPGSCGLRALLPSERGLLAIGCLGIGELDNTSAGWRLVLPAGGAGLYAIAEGPDVRVAVGDQGLIQTASRAEGAEAPVWMTASSGSARALRGIAYGRGRFVAVGAGATVLVSGDGRIWKRSESLLAAWRSARASAGPDSGVAVR